jgi:excisionase family DNA binding protein
MAQTTQAAEEAYTIAEAAAIKRVSPDLIRRAIKATEAPFLKAKKIGRGYRISASELDAWWAKLEDA